MSRHQELLLVTPEHIQRVKNEYGKTDESIKQDVQILLDWWTKQPHLPQVKDEAAIESLLMRNKYRIEQTKKKIDAYYTLKGMHKEFFSMETLDITSKAIQNMKKTYYMFPLRQPGKNGERIFFFGLKNKDASDTYFVLENFQVMFIMYELVYLYDYCDSIRFICDVENFSLNFYKRMEPVLLYKGMKLMQECMSSRISGIAYVNAPGFIDVFIKLFQPLIKEGRINTYKDFASLSDIIDIESLPNEYGGNSGTLDDLEAAWLKEIELHKDFLEKRMNVVSDETKRIGKSAYSEMFGTDGTFKSLNLD